MHDGFGFGFGGIFMWLFWILIIAVVVWGVRAVFGGSEQQGSRSAMEILEERYARGEIGQQEFERKKAELSR